MIEESTLPPHGVPIIHLLKGILYDTNENAWRLLLTHEKDIKKHFSVVGLELFIDTGEGYAFVRQKEYLEGDVNLPKLIEKRQLSYPVTLLCVLLRKRIFDSDQVGNETRIIVSKEQIIEMLKLFLPDSIATEVKLIRLIDEHMAKVIGYGFLAPLKNEADRYEVRRILTAYFTIDKLTETLEKLKTYHQTWLEATKGKKKDELEF